jgi:hypothetical protein
VIGLLELVIAVTGEVYKAPTVALVTGLEITVVCAEEAKPVKVIKNNSKLFFIGAC